MGSNQRPCFATMVMSSKFGRNVKWAEGLDQLSAYKMANEKAQ